MKIEEDDDVRSFRDAIFGELYPIGELYPNRHSIVEPVSWLLYLSWRGGARLSQTSMNAYMNRHLKDIRWSHED